MQYFDETADKCERISKVIGGVFTASILLTFGLIFIAHIF
jgi:hypothetical protein